MDISTIFTTHELTYSYIVWFEIQLDIISWFWINQIHITEEMSSHISFHEKCRKNF